MGDDRLFFERYNQVRGLIFLLLRTLVFDPLSSLFLPFISSLRYVSKASMHYPLHLQRGISC